MFNIQPTSDSVYVNVSSGQPLRYNGLKSIPKNAIYAYLMPVQECLFNGISYIWYNFMHTSTFCWKS